MIADEALQLPKHRFILLGVLNGALITTLDMG